MHGNEKLFTKVEVDRAKLAREVQEYLAWPSTSELIKMVNNNEIQHLDLTADDIRRAVFIYGEAVPYLQGRMTNRRPLKANPIAKPQQPLPSTLHETRLDLYLDIFTFQGCQFLLIESSRVKFLDVYDVMSAKLEDIVPHLKMAMRKYTARGFQVSGVHVDNQFDFPLIEDAVKPANLVPYAAREHVRTIERRNRTVKERMRSLVAGVPFILV